MKSRMIFNCKEMSSKKKVQFLYKSRTLIHREEEAGQVFLIPVLLIFTIGSSCPEFPDN